MKANKEYRDYVLSVVEKTVKPDISQGERWAIFTNEDLEEYTKEKFPDVITEHFGNIRGKNEFNTMHHIAQVGMFRYPPSIYFLYEVFADPELLAKLGNMSEKGEDTHEIIREKISDRNGKTKEIMDRLLLCDIEQNLFRGIIRSSTDEPYTYYLFTSGIEYKKLIRTIKDRYSAAGATVILPEMKMSRHDKFMQWYDDLEENADYENKDIYEIIQLPSHIKLSDWYKDHSDIKTILASNRIEGKRGIYRKTVQTQE